MNKIINLINKLVKVSHKILTMNVIDVNLMARKHHMNPTSSCTNEVEEIININDDKLSSASKCNCYEHEM